ncbi:hypothetical protein ACVRZL_09925, partial [Streptococcus hillyeri]
MLSPVAGKFGLWFAGGVGGVLPGGVLPGGGVSPGGGVLPEGGLFGVGGLIGTGGFGGFGLGGTTVTLF